MARMYPLCATRGTSVSPGTPPYCSSSGVSARAEADGGGQAQCGVDDARGGDLRADAGRKPPEGNPPPEGNHREGTRRVQRVVLQAEDEELRPRMEGGGIRGWSAQEDCQSSALFLPHRRHSPASFNPGAAIPQSTSHVARACACRSRQGCRSAEERGGKSRAWSAGKRGTQSSRNSLYIP